MENIRATKSRRERNPDMPPDRPFWDLLPEIYHDDIMLDLLADAFERCYLNIEHMIDRMPARLYQSAMTPKAFLDFVGALVGLQNENRQFTPAQMRALLPSSVRLHRAKGTRPALAFLIDFYLRSLCGHSVYFRIEEPAGAGVFLDDSELPQNSPDRTENPLRPLSQAQGAEQTEHPHAQAELTVFTTCMPPLTEQEEQTRFEMLVRDYTPAAVKTRVIYLPGGCALGAAVLGGNTML